MLKASSSGSHECVHSYPQQLIPQQVTHIGQSVSWSTVVTENTAIYSSFLFLPPSSPTSVFPHTSISFTLSPLSLSRLLLQPNFLLYPEDSPSVFLPILPHTVPSFPPSSFNSRCRLSNPQPRPFSHKSHSSHFSFIPCHSLPLLHWIACSLHIVFSNHIQALALHSKSLYTSSLSGKSKRGQSKGWREREREEEAEEAEEETNKRVCKKYWRLDVLFL